MGKYSRTYDDLVSCRKSFYKDKVTLEMRRNDLEHQLLLQVC